MIEALEKSTKAGQMAALVAMLAALLSLLAAVAGIAPDGQQIAFTSFGRQPSNPEGDDEVYLMNADGSRQQNITRTGRTVHDVTPDLASAKRN